MVKSLITFYLVIILPLDVLLISFTGEPFNFCAILDDYRMQEKIGEGGFGFVHLATNRETNK